MQLSGQTPLFRAKNLEKYLGVEKIFLKLEGSNPTGHKNDRIAESLVQYAFDQGFKDILVNGTSKYIQSVLYFADLKGMKVSGLKNKSNQSAQKKLSNINWITMKQTSAGDEDQILKEYIQDKNMYYISEWEKEPLIRILSIQKIAYEFLERETNPTHIYTQASGGYTVKGIYHELMRGWVDERLSIIPEIICGISKEKLDGVESNYKLKEALETTKSRQTIVSTEQLKEAARLLKKLESIKITQEEAYPLAALLLEKPKSEGVYIVILNDGKNDIDIKEISKEKDIDKGEIVNQTRNFLEPYSDSVEETADAVEKAIEKGFIFKAIQGDELQGICVVVHMGFTQFIPTYHLAYIGVKKGKKGRGVATMLMNQAIEKTNGNLSLHVDIPNGRAKKLYEKMGFVHMYNRMLYKG